jgi:Domain of unknown function (DUF4168)
MKHLNRVIAATAAIMSTSLVLSIFGFSGVNGQVNAQSPSYSGASESSNAKKIDDATLKRTAAAYVKVRDIALKTQQAVGSTSDESAKQQMMQKAEAEKIAAVKSEGIEPQQYNQVILAVRSNNGLQQKFLSYVQQVQSGATSGSL